MQILGLLGMYFDAAVVFVTNSSLIFRFAMYCAPWLLCFRLPCNKKEGRADTEK